MNFLNHKVITMQGETVPLSQFANEKGLVLIFYPGDFTPVCTKQLCQYRDQYDVLKKYGVSLLGLSKDGPEKHKEFTEKNKFPFPLVTDTENQLARTVGCTSKWLLGMVTRGVVFLNNRGEVTHRILEATPITYPKVESIELVLKKGF